MGKTRDSGSLFFGRSVALLLVMLFVLTGVQMGLSLVRDYSRGTVLGEDDDDEHYPRSRSKKWSGETQVEVTAAPMATPTLATSGESSGATPGESPTLLQMVPVGPTVFVTLTPVSPTTTPTTTVTSEEPPLSGVTESEEPAQASATTTGPSAGETVRTILRQIGLPVRVTPTPAPRPEVITVKEEVVNERAAGEILKELESTVGTGVVREVRLRFVAADGGVGLAAEVKAGQGVLLSAEEATKISETLRLGSGLKVERGSGQGLVFSRGIAKASTNLPLLVDLDSNSLTVGTSLGIRNVAILPDTAVSKAVALGALTDVEGEAMNLIERDDGKIAYRVGGAVGRKLFGLFGIKAKQMIEVSAESGRILPSLTDSLGATLFNLAAPPIR